MFPVGGRYKHNNIILSVTDSMEKVFKSIKSNAVGTDDINLKMV